MGVAALVPPTTTILAPGAMAWTHWTSSAASGDQFRLVGG